MTTAGMPGCAEVEGPVLSLDELRAENAALKAQVETCQTEIVALKAKVAALEKNSSTSSKPPSSDFGKNRKPKNKKKESKDDAKRKRGGQPGHQAHFRNPFDDADVDYKEIFCKECPDCHGVLTRSKQPPKVIQQIELPMPSETISVVGFRSHAGWCNKCKQVHYTSFDDADERAGLFGPRLTTLVGYLKSVCHCSFTTIRRFMRDLFDVRISRGFLAKVVAKISDSLEQTYNDLLKLLPSQDRLNIDETGHKDYKTSMWTWCFRASLFTLFKIDASRGSKVLLEVLGKEFNGIIGCDYFSAYRKYMKDCNVLLQFCLAHFLRDVRFLTEHPNAKNQAYGQRVLSKMRALFGIIHDRDSYTEEGFANALEDAGNELHAEVLYRVPKTREAKNLANRFKKHGDSYLRFITTPGLEPTNNLAEQAIRFVVIDRKITQGSRGETGQRWLERIWTVIATCAQSDQSVFTFLHETVTAFFQGIPAPKLIPDST